MILNYAEAIEEARLRAAGDPLHTLKTKLSRRANPAVRWLMVVLLAISLRTWPQTTSTATGSSPVADGEARNQNQAAPGPKPLPVHIVPYGEPKSPTKTQPASSNQGVVQYWGGPVISNVNVVEVLWGSFVDAPSTNGLDQFFTDITSSNYFSLLGEFSTVGLNGNGAGSPPGSNQTIGSGVFGGKFTINPSVCPGAANSPACQINDTQIQSELANQVAASHLPQPTQDSQGNFNTLYMIYFPPGVSITVQGISSCVGFGFCAYHSNVTSGSRLRYGVHPDFSPASGCGPSKGCGNGSSFENLTMVSSHELGEAVTDAEVGSFNGNVPAPPLAWVDQNSGAEIGDFCNGDATQVTANTRTYTVQKLLSNMQGSCVSAPGHFQVTAQANANPGKPFNITVAPQSSLGNASLTAYNNTVHFTSSDGTAVLPANYTFVPATDSGSHTFSVTLNGTGSQTVTVNDTLVSGLTGNASIMVSNFPDLAAVSSHGSSFTQGQIGAIYTLTVTNTGNSPTSGTVTVVDTLPPSLSATAISGAGWACTLATLTCTRSDALAANNASYPAITLTMNVDPRAPTPVINTVHVSTSGDLNPTNDTGLDSTVIVQLADLVIAKSHNGNFSQGQTGETYTLTVTNAGTGSTVGAVTVVDTLPTGLTATNISGANWTCPNLSPPTCTTSVVIGPNVSFPPITLTVNIAASAPMPTVTNIATVSGGGEVITNNDTANDVTVITPPAPDLVVTSTHSGNFTQGQAGVYTLTVSNIGPASTDGSLVTVTDILPGGLAVASAVGMGWSCAVAINTPVFQCTRSDALTPANSYPPITVTVNVSPTASPFVTNVVSVGGGGDFDNGESSSDPTIINQLADLTLNIGGVGSLVAGATGATFSWIVSNVGPTPTSGVVIFTDTVGAGGTPTNIAGAGWNCVLSTLTCTRSDSLAAQGSYPPITLTLNYAVSASTVTQTATVGGGGEANTANDSITDIAHLTFPLFVQTLSPTTATVSAGSAATFTFGVSDFLAPEAVTFTCASLPPGAACNFSQSSQTQAGANITLTITTTGPSASLQPFWNRMTPLYAVLLPCLGLRAFVRGRKKRSLGLLIPCLLLAALLTLPGCGGSSQHGPPPVATPPGTYTVNMTASNSTVNFQVSTPITLNVK